MTAACFPTSEAGIVSCRCPVFDGPYQLGTTLPPAQCTVGGDLVWSAAFAPGAAAPSPVPQPAAAAAARTVANAKSIPVPTTCFPDAPGGLGCPLFVPGQTLPPGSGVDCTKVCAEYSTCTGTGGIQIGLTCDATLCTDNCNDRDLVKTACGGLSTCDVSEIVKAKEAGNAVAARANFADVPPIRRPTLRSPRSISSSATGVLRRNATLTARCAARPNRSRLPAATPCVI